MNKLFNRAAALTVATGCLFPAARAMAGNLDPTNAPGPTMHTLEEIYQKVSVTQMLSEDTPVMTAGTYAATNLASIDRDLAAGNIAGGVTIFGITGTLNTIPAPVAKTGQAASMQVGDDGALQKGVPWPNPRFNVLTGLSSNCVLDNLSGLMWVRNPDAETRSWSNALAYCAALDGAEGRGGYTDWRLPNKKELESLVDCRYAAPALPNTTGVGQLTDGDPFAGVQPSGVYWSSSAYAASNGAAWALSLSDGSVIDQFLTNACYVWSVRAGYTQAGVRDYSIINEDKGVTMGASSFAGHTASAPIKPGSFTLLLDGGISGYFTDNGSGQLSGFFFMGVNFNATGMINYDTGTFGVTVSPLSIPPGCAITVSYTVRP